MADRISVEVEGVSETSGALDRVAGDLADAGKQRAAAQVATDRIRTALIAAASRSPTPQARLVAAALLSQPGMNDAAVAVDSGRTAGNGTAGELLPGSEHGGTHFAAPINPGGYWIAPTLAKAPQEAERAYQALVDAATQEAGF